MVFILLNDGLELIHLACDDSHITPNSGIAAMSANITGVLPDGSATLLGRLISSPLAAHVDRKVVGEDANGNDLVSYKFNAAGQSIVNTHADLAMGLALVFDALDFKPLLLACLAFIPGSENMRRLREKRLPPAKRYASGEDLAAAAGKSADK